MMTAPWRSLSSTAWRSSAAGYRYRDTATISSRCLAQGVSTQERCLPATWAGLGMFSKTPTRSYSHGTGGTSADESNELLCETKGNAGVLILNRPEQMNALNTNIMRKFGHTLTSWVKEDKKTAIIVKSSGGKVFSAGGDVRLIIESAMLRTDKGRELMNVGYSKGIIINECPIPYCALIDGMVMGGAVGISANGRYRVGTERTAFAMPEMNLGFYPDCAATHFLPRLKGKLGHFLVLSSYRLTAADVYHAGVATHAVDSANLASLEHDLCHAQERKDVNQILDRYTQSAQFIQKPFSLAPHLDEIDDYFSAPTVEEIIQRMQKSGTAFASAALKRMSAASPLSLKVTKRALDESINKTLAECLETEYRISARLGYHYNFVEGVRATLIAKTGSPEWEPARLEDCTPEMVNSFFEPLPGDKLVLDAYS